jgi:hypothetical protein
VQPQWLHVAFSCPTPPGRVRYIGVFRRGHQLPSAFHISCILGGGRTPCSGSLQDPVGGDQQNAVLEPTWCSLCQRSLVPDRGTYPWLSTQLHDKSQRDDQSQCLVGEQRAKKCHAATPDDFNRIQLQGWRHKFHSPLDELVTSVCDLYSAYSFSVLPSLICHGIQTITFVLFAFVNRPIRSNSPIRMSKDSCSQTGS